MAKNNDNKRPNNKYEKSEQSGNKKTKEQIKKLPAMQKKNSHRAKAVQKAAEQQVKIDLAELEATKKSAKNDVLKKTAKVEAGDTGKRKAQPHTEKTTQSKRKPANNPQKEKAVPSVRFNENAKVRIIPLGGLNEIGKNMTAIECGDDIIVVDCGLAFPDEETPGVDLIIPDVTYLEATLRKCAASF